MGNNLDYSQREVRDEMHAWGEWIVKEVRLSGFRLDAVKHFSQGFLKEWIARLDAKFQKKLFFVGEYWYDDIRVLGPVIEKFEGRLSLFDTPLAGNMSKLSKEGSRGDLRQILNGTLAKHYPHQAVVSIVHCLDSFRGVSRMRQILTSGADIRPQPRHSRTIRTRPSGRSDSVLVHSTRLRFHPPSRRFRLSMRILW